ncbi:Zn-ribbon domain-containing OB-fold protein [Nonomuraea thailandensis]
MQRCTACDRRIHLPEPACPWCGGHELVFEPASGDGLVHTYTVVHRSFAPAYRGREPYVMAWVDLPEGCGRSGTWWSARPSRCASACRYV